MRRCLFALALLCGPFATSAVADHPWAMRNSTQNRSGQSTYRGATAGTLDWRFLVAGFVNQFAVASDGSIYLGNVFNQEYWSNENYIYGLTATGELKWRQKVTPYEWGVNQAIKGSPALDSSGNVVIPSTNTELLKYTGAGDFLWRYLGNPIFVDNSSPAVLSDDSIRHTIWDAGLLALTLAGVKLWNNTAGNVLGVVAVGPNGAMAIGGIKSSEYHGSVALQYFSPTGVFLWSKSTPSGAEGTPIIGPDGTIFAPFLSAAYNPDGSVKWSNGVRSATAALGANGVLYYATAFAVTAVNSSNGAVLWTTNIPGGGVNPDPAIDSGDNIFVTTTTGSVWSINAAGGINWNAKFCEKFVTGPVVGGTGNLIACGQDRFKFYVYSIK
jgi:hypothetical protein